MSKAKGTRVHRGSKETRRRGKSASVTSYAPSPPNPQAGNRDDEPSRKDVMMWMLDGCTTPPPFPSQASDDDNPQVGTVKSGNTDLDDDLLFIRQLTIQQGMGGDAFDAWLYRAGTAFRTMGWRTWGDVNAMAFMAWYRGDPYTGINLIEDAVIRTPQFLRNMQYFVSTLLDVSDVPAPDHESMRRLLRSVQQLMQAESRVMSVNLNY